LTPQSTFTIIVHGTLECSPRRHQDSAGWIVGITELIVVMVVALILIPPDKLPEVMRTVGKILRELRLASNTVMRELTEFTDDPLAIRRPPPAVAQPSQIQPTATEPPASSSSAEQPPDVQP
jgi:Sec-independent protein translocase protein TatA